MKVTKLIIILSLTLAFAGTAFAQSGTQVVLNSWVKPVATDVAWQKDIQAKPGDTIIVRFGAHNISDKVIENVTVKLVLPKNVDYKGNLVVDYRDAKLYKGEVIAIGTLVPNRTKYVTFQVKVKNANYVFGETKLPVVMVTNQTPGDIETSNILIHKRSVKGTNIGPVTPTQLNTGLDSTVMDFIAIPVLLSMLAIVLFRKQLLALSTGYTSSVHRAEYDIARIKLDRKIENLKK